MSIVEPRGPGGDVICIYDGGQMEYVVPETIQSYTSVRCPSCKIVYQIPNEIFKHGWMKLKAYLG